MRTLLMAVAIAALSAPLVAQAPNSRPRRPDQVYRTPFAAMTEGSIKQAMDQFAPVKKVMDRDIEVFRHVSAADTALIDDMQPNNSIQKALEEVVAAKALSPPMPVFDGIIKIERALEEARLSPTSADFGKLRSTLRQEALGPALRQVARNGTALQEEILSWIKIQELVTTYVKTLSEASTESIRAAQQY